MAKILISAYACEPNKGSEPEVGWQWVMNIAKKHEVWVLTKDNNKGTIENYIQSGISNLPIENLHFVYVGLPSKLTFWKKGNKGMRPYYYLWQKKAYRIAKQLHKSIGFDLVHSVTFVSMTQPCFLYKLGIPFVWTIAGGENIPSIINYPLRPKEKMYEIIRSVGQVVSKHSVRVHRAFKMAELVLATTYETYECVPNKYKDKVVITSAIGIDQKRECKKYDAEKEGLDVLLGGKFVYLKGVEIGIKAIVKVAEQYPNVRFCVLGNGPYERLYKKICEKYLDKNIRFVSKVPHDKMFEFYTKYDFMLNTALRDSGCLVAMEAMSVGVPIVCLDTGGVKEMTTHDIAVKIKPCRYDELVEKFSEAICEFIQNPKKCEELGKAAYKHINDNYLYPRKADWLLERYELILNGRNQ